MAGEHLCGRTIKLRILFGELFRAWKPKFISIIFPIIPVTSECPIQVGYPGSCLACPPLNPALAGRKEQKVERISRNGIDKFIETDGFNLSGSSINKLHKE